MAFTVGNTNRECSYFLGGMVGFVGIVKWFLWDGRE